MLVFQHGLRLRGDLGHRGDRAINVEMPIVIFAFLFGISMDYQVFIISRMREAYDRTGSTETAVVEGIGRTGRLVTSAALILGLAFVAFSASPGTEAKIFATALGGGILIDATIIRGILAPAAVAILGRWNWWLPDWAARILRVEPSPAEPDAAPVRSRARVDRRRQRRFGGGTIGSPSVVAGPPRRPPLILRARCDEFCRLARSNPRHHPETGAQMNDTAGPAVLAEGLVKHYTGREGTVEAVRGVDLEVATGEIFGFLGPNGAGKSTTVRMLTTLLTITSGRAEVAGVDVARDPDGVRRRIGVALQEAGLDPRQTGRELLVLHGRLFGLSAAEAKERAQRAAGAGRARGRRGPGDQGLLRRHAAPARPRGGARARARGPVPGRADHRPRPGEPADGLGGAAPDQRARARRCSSRRSTSRRPTSSATASRSSTTA